MSSGGLKPWPMVDPSMPVGEMELRGCSLCNTDGWATKHADPALDGLKVRHVLMGHDRDAACDRANRWGQSWNASIAASSDSGGTQ